MMANKYVRLTKGLIDRGTLIKAEEDIQKFVDEENDYYLSPYQYDENQYERFKQQGGSVAGIRNVTTDSLWWDFDNAENPEVARQDAITLVDRLHAHGISEDHINVYFSGRKGFEVSIKGKNTLTPREVNSICTALADSLTTFDESLYDSNQIFRVPGTKHQESGLYKTQMKVDDLRKYSFEEIKKFAKTKYPLRPKQPIVLPESILSLTPATPEPTKVNTTVNIADKPKWMCPTKWAIQQGRYEQKEGNEARMILAATYRAQGFDAEMTRQMVTLAEERRAERIQTSVIDQEELERTVISVVYSPTWQGGQYSVHTNSLLKKIAEREGITIDESVSSKLIQISDVAGDFKHFAKNIEQNRITTGIPGLDDKLIITTGMPWGIIGAPGSGKCLGYGTKVRMYDGSLKEVQNIKPGDILMGDDSTPRTVLSTTKGREEMFRIKQENGFDYVVNKSHILSLKCGASFKNPKLAKKYIRGKVMDVSVSDYLKMSAKSKKYYKGYKVPIEYKKKKLYMDPYVLGVWLGDGDKTKSSITNPDTEVIEYFDKIFLCDTNMHKSVYDGITHTYASVRGRNNNNIFLKQLQKYNLLGNKHIPNDFMINSRQNRLELLAGILDADGTCDGSNFTVSTTNENLGYQIVELVRSLGFRAAINKRIAKYDCIAKRNCVRYKGESEHFSIYISGTNLGDIPTKIPRKQCRSYEMSNNPLLTRIELEPLGEGDYYGFTIDGNRRFLLEDYTVTHNTSIAINMLRHNSEQGILSVFASIDISKRRLYEKLALNHLSRHYGRQDLYEFYKTDSKIAKDIDEKIKKEFKNVYLFAQTSPNVVELKKYILSVEQATGKKVKFVVIDYFERISSDYQDDTASSKRVAGELQDLAIDTDVSLLTMFQPNKLSGDPSEPIRSYLNVKGSSFIQQSLRMILSVYREGFSPENSDNDKFLTINCLKDDLGGLFSRDYHWGGRTGAITNLNPADKRDLDSLRENKKEPLPGGFGGGL